MVCFNFLFLFSLLMSLASDSILAQKSKAHILVFGVTCSVFHVLQKFTCTRITHIVFRPLYVPFSHRRLFKSHHFVEFHQCIRLHTKFCKEKIQYCSYHLCSRQKSTCNDDALGIHTHKKVGRTRRKREVNRNETRLHVFLECREMKRETDDKKKESFAFGVCIIVMPIYERAPFRHFQAPI